MALPFCHEFLLLCVYFNFMITEDFTLYLACLFQKEMISQKQFFKFCFILFKQPLPFMTIPKDIYGRNMLSEFVSVVEYVINHIKEIKFNKKLRIVCADKIHISPVTSYVKII